MTAYRAAYHAPGTDFPVRKLLLSVAGLVFGFWICFPFSG